MNRQTNQRGATFGEQGSAAGGRGRHEDSLTTASESHALAFFAFGSGSALQSALQLGLIPSEEGCILALVLGAFVFPPLAVAAILAFLTREGLGATALGLISFSWLSTAFVLYVSPPPATSNVLGGLSLIVAVVLLLLGITAVFGKLILAVHRLGRRAL